MAKTSSTTDPVTVDHLRTLLGLQDPLDHKLESRWRLANLKTEHDDITEREVMTRRGGRTTEMVLQALVHVANTGDKVVFVAENQDLANYILRIAHEYAKVAGISSKGLRAISKKSKNKVRGLRPEQIFTDHTLTEGI